MIAIKQLERYKRISSSCDHTKMTETLGATKCCFCCKLMHVISENAKCTTTDFADQMFAYSLSMTGIGEVV